MSTLAIQPDYQEGVSDLNLSNRFRRMGSHLKAALRMARCGLAHSGMRPQKQVGHILFQEFLPHNEFDTRITVIGNRAFGFRRLNRPGDFRASGSGQIDWDPSGIEIDAVDLAFKTARTIGSQSLAVDVLRQKDGTLCVTEISYYYEGWAVAACPGHWLDNGDWQSGQVSPEDAIFDDFVADVTVRNENLSI